jgi:hypothetical protein
MESKLKEVEGRLEKEVHGTKFGIEKGFNTGVVITKPSGEMAVMQLSNSEDMSVLALWIFKNYEIMGIPNYSELDKVNAQLANYRSMAGDTLERMNEYGLLVKRLSGLLKSILESYSSDLLPDAVIQIKTAIQDVSKFQD